MRLQRHEMKIVLLLCAIQFVHSIDFVLMMPLAPIFMKDFQISPQYFSLLVSSYTWASSIFGFLGALFVDRFDRRHVLLSAFAGFIFGTFLCALAQSAEFLLFARSMSGMFAGVMVSTVFSIVGDSIPEQRRGTALGIVMAAFPIASVLGIPLAIYIANAFDWHFAFAAVAGVSVVIAILVFKGVPSIRGHIEAARSLGRVERLKHFIVTGKFWPAYIFSIVIMLAAFTVIPFIAASLVQNSGIPMNQLHWVYLCGGLFTFCSSQIFGRRTDRYGKLKMFRWLALISIFPILIVTNLPQVPLWIALVVITLFMMFISGRFVPGMALLTGSVSPQERGVFMSVNTSFQQFASGVATALSGWLVTSDSTGVLVGYNRVGWVAVFFTLLAILLAGRIHNARLRPESAAGSNPGL